MLVASYWRVKMWDQKEERESGWEKKNQVLLLIRISVLLNESQLNWYDKIFIFFKWRHGEIGWSRIGTREKMESIVMVAIDYKMKEKKWEDGKRDKNRIH